MQMFSEGKADDKDAYYYQREWRLGKQNLAPVEMWNHPDNPRTRIMNEGYPYHCGKLFSDGKNEFYQFTTSDVAFLISPQDWKAKITNPYNFPIEDYEKHVENI